jgi:hypothetical protein
MKALVFILSPTPYAVLTDGCWWPRGHSKG